MNIEAFLAHLVSPRLRPPAVPATGETRRDGRRPRRASLREGLPFAVSGYPRQVSRCAWLVDAKERQAKESWIAKLCLSVRDSPRIEALTKMAPDEKSSSSGREQRVCWHCAGTSTQWVARAMSCPGEGRPRRTCVRWHLPLNRPKERPGSRRPSWPAAIASRLRSVLRDTPAEARSHQQQSV